MILRNFLEFSLIGLHFDGFGMELNYIALDINKVFGFQSHLFILIIFPTQSQYKILRLITEY